MEQILSELKEIKQLFSENISFYDVSPKGKSNDTMAIKEAAKYLGIAEFKLRLLSKQGKIKHITAGRKFLYKRNSLDQWLKEIQDSSIKKNNEVSKHEI